MRIRTISILFLFVWITTACQPSKTTATATLLPTVPGTAEATQPAAGQTTPTAVAQATQAPTTMTPTPAPVYPPPLPTAVQAYPPPGQPTGPAIATAPAGMNTVLLLKDLSQGKSIVAYYDPSLWQAGPSETYSDSWSGQTLNSIAIAGCTLRFTGGFDPDPSWQSQAVSVSINPNVTLYETFTQSGVEVLRLYKVSGYESAFAVRLDSVNADSQTQCVQQIEQVLGTIMIQSAYP